MAFKFKFPVWLCFLLLIIQSVITEDGWKGCLNCFLNYCRFWGIYLKLQKWVMLFIVKYVRIFAVKLLVFVSRNYHVNYPHKAIKPHLKECKCGKINWIAFSDFLSGILTVVTCRCLIYTSNNMKPVLLSYKTRITYLKKKRKK